MLFAIIILAHNCFATQLSLRIFGGVDAKPDEFPFVVRIELQTSYNITNNTMVYHHQHVCTASSLSPEWLLSAAHCLIITEEGIELKEPSSSTNKMVIRYGHVKDSPWIKDSFRDVLLTVMHPHFVINKFSIKGIATKNDIGLLRVSPINMRSYIKLSAVDYQAMYGQEALIAGFGVTTKTNAEGKVITDSSLNLGKALQLLKVLVSKCSDVSSLVPGLCLASRCKDVTTSCPGDSGGPIIHTSGLIGVLSLGTGSGYCSLPFAKQRVNIAATITPVSPYIEWIYSFVSDTNLINSG